MGGVPRPPPITPEQEGGWVREGNKGGLNLVSTGWHLALWDGACLLCPFPRAGSAWHMTCFLKAATSAPSSSTTTPSPTAWEGDEVQNQITCLLPRLAPSRHLQLRLRPLPSFPSCKLHPWHVDTQLKINKGHMWPEMRPVYAKRQMLVGKEGNSCISTPLPPPAYTFSKVPATLLYCFSTIKPSGL